MTTSPRASEAMRALMPAVDADEAAYPPAFRALAELLLNRSTLRVQGVAHRFTEIEFYFKGRRHLDRFTHGDPMQKQFGRWYFHRTAGEYRGGTYKGLDLAFGDDDAPAGILVRGIERTEGTAALIDGPCMVVDHVLALAQHPSIQALVATFDLSADASATSPLYVQIDPTSRGATVHATPRVGLSLKRFNTADRHQFIARDYRFLTEPLRIKKGRVHLVLALHRRGASADQIAALTGTRSSVIEGYIRGFEGGRARSPAEFSADLSTADTCALFGACEGLQPPLV